VFEDDLEEEREESSQSNDGKSREDGVGHTAASVVSTRRRRWRGSSRGGPRGWGGGRRRSGRGSHGSVVGEHDCDRIHFVLVANTNVPLASSVQILRDEEEVLITAIGLSFIAAVDAVIVVLAVTEVPSGKGDVRIAGGIGGVAGQVDVSSGSPRYGYSGVLSGIVVIGGVVVSWNVEGPSGLGGQVEGLNDGDGAVSNGVVGGEGVDIDIPISETSVGRSAVGPFDGDVEGQRSRD